MREQSRAARRMHSSPCILYTSSYKLRNYTADHLGVMACFPVSHLPNPDSCYGRCWCRGNSQTALPTPGAHFGTWAVPAAASSRDSRTKADTKSNTLMARVVTTSMVISSIFQRAWSPWKGMQKDSAFACAYASFSIHCWFSESGRHERPVTV